ncbi:DUF4184 family protein [Dactylosporangium sucinum]|uniref:DUF4184 family protein n=1 Tax=Dactylosporangium sucinum TaxID=1424081 RepID=A0A917UBR6_9ACTN|nr:DUF4184 family protein [Dactylosporangium sucinum]GGM70112.1 hypothetical protein GCM10007977_084900 [Dactylosporangium sucinum]
MPLTFPSHAAAPVVVAHLPRGGPLRRFAVGDYAALAARRHPWAITVLSAWLGAVSHRLWDLVTHAANADRGTERLTFLDATAFAGQPWWRVLHYGSTVAGALVVLAVALHAGRTGWLRDGVAAVPVAARRPAVFWTAALAVWVPGLAVQPFLAWFTAPQAVIVRLLELGAAGLLVAALVTRFLSDSQVRSGTS